MIQNINFLRIKVYAFSLCEVGDWWSFQNHISPFARIFLIKDGEQRVTFHEREYEHCAGGLALIPPYTPVSYKCDDYCHQYYFIFTCHLPNGKDLFADCKFSYLLESKICHHIMCDDLYARLPDFGLLNVDADSIDFNDMIFATNLHNLSLDQKLATQGLVSLLMAEFAEGAERLESLIRFSKAFMYIESNLENDLSLEVLSELEGMSKTYFSDQFTLHTGVRPSEYIARKRESKAKELLTTTNLSLKEIASQTGFSDLSYFFRFYKKRVGVTPRKYRLNSLRGCPS